MFSAPTKIAAVCAALLLTAGNASRAADQDGYNGARSYLSNSLAAARLQVTGTETALSVDAERADAQSALKAVLKQAGKQYIPDATVAGQATALLTDQPLKTVLDAICGQCYLKYAVLPGGVYKFSRDDAAIQEAFKHLNALNADLRVQLRSLGFGVPGDEALSASTQQFGGGFAGGASRGGEQIRSAAPSAAQNTTASRAAIGRVESAAGGPAASTSDKPADLKDSTAIKRSLQNKIADIHADFLPQERVQMLVNPNAGPQSLYDYNSVVRQNGFVWFDIPEEKPEPVATVLQRFSQQANVPILLDLSIPNGLKFRVWGSLSPRQLPEALNVLAPTAHLQWRWIGNAVFVVPAPNFQVQYGDLPQFRGQYPAAQRTEGAAPGARSGRGQE